MYRNVPINLPEPDVPFLTIPMLAKVLHSNKSKRNANIANIRYLTSICRHKFPELHLILINGFQVQGFQ